LEEVKFIRIIFQNFLNGDCIDETKQLLGNKEVLMCKLAIRMKKIQNLKLENGTSKK